MLLEIEISISLSISLPFKALMEVFAWNAVEKTF